MMDENNLAMDTAVSRNQSTVSDFLDLISSVNTCFYTQCLRKPLFIKSKPVYAVNALPLFPGFALGRIDQATSNVLVHTYLTLNICKE